MFPLLLPISCCGQFVRVDSLGLLLSLLALSLIIADKKLLFFLSPLVLVLAFFTKFNFALLIVPIFIMMLITRKAKWALYFLGFAVLASISFFLLNSTTEGAFFNDTFVYIGSSPYSLSTALRFMVNIMVSYSFISLTFLGLLFDKKSLIENEKELLIFLCLLTEIPFLVFAMGKQGSSHNQFFQLSALAILALGIILGKSKDGWEYLEAKIGSLILFTVPLFLIWLASYYLLREMYPQLMLFFASAIYILVISTKFKLNKMAVNFCLAILLFAQVSVLYFRPLGLLGENVAPDKILESWELNKEYYLKITEIFKKNPGPALTYWTGSLVLSGKDSVIEPFVLNNMLNAGLFDTEKLYANISQKKYSVIIMPAEFATLRDFGEEARTPQDNNTIFARRDFIEVAMENYKVGGKVGSAEVLYPKTEDP